MRWTTCRLLTSAPPLHHSTLPMGAVSPLMKILSALLVSPSSYPRTPRATSSHGSLEYAPIPVKRKCKPTGIAPSASFQVLTSPRLPQASPEIMGSLGVGHQSDGQSVPR